MYKCLVEWIDERTVWTEIESEERLTKDEAIKKVLKGEGKEVDWSGSKYPDNKEQIQDFKQED